MARVRGVFGKASIAFIRLQRGRYEQIYGGELIGSTDTLDRLARTADYGSVLDQRIVEHEDDLEPLRTLGFHGLDAKVKSRDTLSYEEAFSLVAFVCMATNRPLFERLKDRTGGAQHGLLDDHNLVIDHGISLLQAMSTREAIIGLQSQEIAGMIAATVELDTVIRVSGEHAEGVFAIGGMGGDRGIRVNGAESKLFSVSTITAMILADYGFVHKHHSYPNTSKVSG